MDRYNKYIEGLRGHKNGLDGERMLKGIEKKVRAGKRAALGSIGGGMIAAAIVLFFVFSSTMAGDGGLVYSYVFEQQVVSDGPVINYVFDN